MSTVLIGVGVGGNTANQRYNLTIDDITVTRKGLSLPTKSDQNLISPVNSEMEFVNRVVQGVPGLIAAGGKAIRLDASATPTIPLGHQFPALFSGVVFGMQNYSVEMWFRTTAPLNASIRKRHVLHAHQTFNAIDDYYGLFINAQSKTVDFVARYDDNFVISMLLNNETQPHHVVLSFSANFNESTGYDFNATLILDGVSKRLSSQPPPYCTVAPVFGILSLVLIGFVVANDRTFGEEYVGAMANYTSTEGASIEIDELAFYDYTLSAARALEHFNQGKLVPSPPSYVTLILLAICIDSCCVDPGHPRRHHPLRLYLRRLHLLRHLHHLSRTTRIVRIWERRPRRIGNALMAYGSLLTQRPLGVLFFYISFAGVF